MKSLIIPMAGKSSRFPNTRPKWMLTHPMSGNFMCIESIMGLNLDFFDRIYFTFLKGHEDTYRVSKGISESLKKAGISEKCEMVILENETKSQSETVYETIKMANISGFVLVKDSDNFFKVKIESIKNQVCFFDLNDVDEINARSKSYIQMDTNGIVTNIVEKKVVSPHFSVGGYGFSSADKFCKYYEKLSKQTGECFLSNVIFEMILSGEIFYGTKSYEFLDWGTSYDWEKYCRNFYTIFVDMDGTLITNTSSIIPPYIGDGEPIFDNINILNSIYDKGLCKIIITTSRKEEYRDLTLQELKRNNIKYDMLIMDLPHCQRILINDYAPSNPYPSAISVNISRNTNTLKDLFPKS